MLQDLLDPDLANEDEFEQVFGGDGSSDEYEPIFGRSTSSSSHGHDDCPDNEPAVEQVGMDTGDPIIREAFSNSEH